MKRLFFLILFFIETLVFGAENINELYVEKMDVIKNPEKVYAVLLNADNGIERTLKINVPVPEVREVTESLLSEHSYLWAGVKLCLPQ